MSRRGFLGAAGAAVAGTVWMPLAATACTPAGAPPIAAPPAFPADIALHRQLYENWSGEIRADGVWTCVPAGANDAVRVVEWARRHGYRIRARGAMHGWSPLTVVPGSDLSRVVLLDTSLLAGISIDPTPLLPTVTVGTGLLMDELLDALVPAGLGLASTPATGAMTVGGALAIDAHGAAAGAIGEAPNPGTGFGSLSNHVVSLEAVVWDPKRGRYALRVFERHESLIRPLLTHLGRGLVTRVTLQVGAAERLRCQSLLDIGVDELFADPSVAGAQDRTFGRMLAESGRIEVIWFPFTETPWVKVWTPSPVAPAPSKEVTGAYNYAFSDHIPIDLAHLLGALVAGNPGAAVDFGRFQLAAVELGMASDGTTDLWGWTGDVTRYIRPATLRMTEGGGAILCRRDDVQQVVSGFASWHAGRLRDQQAAGKVAMNGPVEIRCSGLDQPGDVRVPSAGPPLLSALRPRPDRPEWDVAVWIDALTSPGTPGAADYYHDMGQWLVATAAAGDLGVFRPEWSKGWAYGPAGGWSDPATLRVTIPASLTVGQPPGEGWDAALHGLDQLDPHRIFSNPFLDQLMPRA